MEYLFFAPEYEDVLKTLEKHERKCTKNMIVIHLADIPLIQNKESTQFIEEYYQNHEDPFARSHYCIGTIKTDVGIVKMVPDHYIGYNACGNGDKGTFDINAINISVCVPRTYTYVKHYELERFNEPFGYVDKIIEKLVDLVSNLMINENITIDMVMFHREAHEAGYASQKPCVLDLLEKYGYSADSFRKRVLENLVYNDTELTEYATKKLLLEKNEVGIRYKKDITYGDVSYKVITQEMQFPNGDIEKRFENLSLFYSFRFFDCFSAYLLGKFPNLEEAEAFNNTMIKNGYQTQITIEDPDYDYMDQRYQFKLESSFKEGDYMVEEDLKVYEHPLDISDDGEILDAYKAGNVINMKKGCILNGHTTSWLYIPSINKYACIKNNSNEYIKLQNK